MSVLNTLINLKIVSSESLMFLVMAFFSLSDQCNTVNSAAETPAERESPERASRIMSGVSEAKLGGESPTKSREAPLPAHTTSGKNRSSVFYFNSLSLVTV